MEGVSLREYIEAILDERLRAHQTEHILEDRALTRAREEINARLERLTDFDNRLTSMEAFRSRSLGFAALLALLSGVIGAVIRGLFG